MSERRAAKPVLSVHELDVHFDLRKGLFNRVVGTVQAVSGVSFDIYPGETLGLVGESGSGKTTTGRSILRAIDPTHGAVMFETDHGPVDLASLRPSELRPLRPQMQMIFQDPYSSLNPRMTVRDIIAEPLIVNGLASGADLEHQVRDIARRCRLNIEHLRRYPHAFSGGQRQRIGIARALATNPSLIVADESVSALDVSIQAEVLNLLADLQSETKMAILFIAHDLSVVAHLAHRVAVMYLGRIVELAPTAELFGAPKHPYTEALLSAIPSLDPDARLAPAGLEGEVPSATAPPPGCHLNPRCAYVVDRCRTEVPELLEVAPGHLARCHRADDLELRSVAVEVSRPT